MKTYAYRIDAARLPKGAAERIVWALNKWQKESGGRVRFQQDSEKPNIIFASGKPPPNEKNPLDPFEAYYYNLGNGVFSIVFDPSVRWATTWLQRKLPWYHDFDKMLLHEIGHVLLGPDHSDDPESIMYFKPKQAAIDNTTLKLLSFVCILLLTSCRTHVQWVKTEYIYHPLFAEGNIFANH